MTHPEPSDLPESAPGAVARAGAAAAGVALRRPWLSFAVVLLLGLGAAQLAVKVTFDTRFDALLPDDDPVVREARQLQKRAFAPVPALPSSGRWRCCRRLGGIRGY